MVIAALIIKHKLNLSDEETILTIQENYFLSVNFIKLALEHWVPGGEEHWSLFGYF